MHIMYVCIRMHKYTNISYYLHCCCLCVYGFNTDHFVLNNQLGVHAWDKLILHLISWLEFFDSGVPMRFPFFF